MTRQGIEDLTVRMTDFGRRWISLVDEISSSGITRKQGERVSTPVESRPFSTVEESVIPWLLPVADQQLLFERVRGASTGAEMPTPVAVAVGIAWAGAVWAASVWVFARSDIGE
jgi:hypothetical protein